MKYLREYSIIIKQIYGSHNVKNIAISMITRINYGIIKLIRIITKTIRQRHTLLTMWYNYNRIIVIIILL